MSLRFFADHCVSNFVIQSLRDSGCEVLRLKDHLPIESVDAVVTAKAQDLDSILLSLMEVLLTSSCILRRIIKGSSLYK